MDQSVVHSQCSSVTKGKWQLAFARTPSAFHEKSSFRHGAALAAKVAAKQAAKDAAASGGAAGSGGGGKSRK